MDYAYFEHFVDLDFAESLFFLKTLFYIIKYLEGGNSLNSLELSPTRRNRIGVHVSYFVG